MSVFHTEGARFKSCRGGHFFRRKLVKFCPWCRWQGAEISNVTYFPHNVTYLRSLAVLRGGFVKLYNLVHSLTGLTPLVHFCPV